MILYKKGEKMSIDDITEREWDQAIKNLATKKQVGGNHYKHFKIQPVEYILANDIGYCLGNVIKLISRKKENTIEDLLKAKHHIDLELQIVHGVDKMVNS